MRTIILIHYGELALKGAIRSYFEERLVGNILHALDDLGPLKVQRLYGRLVLSADRDDLDAAKACERLGDVFGLSWFAPAAMCKTNWEEIHAAADRVLPKGGPFTFGVKAKKADPKWPLGRTETSAKLGAYIKESRGWPVNLDEPQVQVMVEIVNGDAIVTCSRFNGLNGLPVGVSGRVMALLSGGIDSPVAAWMMMSRGCTVHAVHFHSAPHTSPASQDKVRRLARTLHRYQQSVHLMMVPFAPCQQEIVRNAPARLRVLLYRRFMMRIAERLARRANCEALVTGESVGQVASQTISNIGAVQAAVDLPILRPLVALDKEAISRRARRIGTFDISIEPHDDCCTFLVPANPATSSSAEELEAAESGLDVERLVFDATRAAEVVKGLGDPS